MVERLRDHYQIRDLNVLEAMRTVPRHNFVPEALQSRAYGDHALPISASQTISQPYIVARMTELLEVDSGSKVLEIGAGSGYQTAVLAKVAGQVYSTQKLTLTNRRSRSALLSRRPPPHAAVVVGTIHQAKNQAGTDAGAWRARGVPVYGIYPYPITNDELRRMHGNDERVSVASLQQGTEMIYRTLVSVAGKAGNGRRTAPSKPARKPAR